MIPGGSYSKDQWENIRRAGAAPPASTLFPLKDPYDPNGDPAAVIPEEKWSSGMKNMASYAKDLALRVLGRGIEVRFETRFGAVDVANYAPGYLCFNVSRLGYKWFDSGVWDGANELLIHELAHEYGDHLTEEFDDGMSRIGAKMTTLALKEPEFFRKYGMK